MFLLYCHCKAVCVQVWKQYDLYITTEKKGPVLCWKIQLHLNEDIKVQLWVLFHEDGNHESVA